jgi:hypothetical protein
MSASTTISTARTAGSRNNTLIVRSIIVVALLGLFALLAFLAVQWFGVVAGEEFSPDTFARRSFYYLEVPLVRAKISPVYHEDITGPLEKRVRGDGKLFPASTAKQPRWHLVKMERSNREYTGDAAILCRYFDDEGDTARRWLQWNRKHAELAKILWPAIAEVGRGELYTFVPELFALAERLTTDAEHKPTTDAFRAAMGDALARQYVARANAEQGLEQHKEAVVFYSAALKHDANDIAALRGRALSYAALNESAKANADREAVKKLERAARG